MGSFSASAYPVMNHFVAKEVGGSFRASRVHGVPFVRIAVEESPGPRRGGGQYLQVFRCIVLPTSKAGHPKLSPPNGAAWGSNCVNGSNTFEAARILPFTPAPVKRSVATPARRAGRCPDGAHHKPPGAEACVRARVAAETT